MSKTKARFIVDREGRITDRESCTERFFEYNSEVNRAKRLKEENTRFDVSDPITPEQREKFIWDSHRENLEPTSNFGALIGGLGILSLVKASASLDSIGWWVWGSIGVTLVAVASLMFIWIIIVTFHDP